jgi:hypothetical protein
MFEISGRLPDSARERLHQIRTHISTHITHLNIRKQEYVTFSSNSFQKQTFKLPKPTP